MSIAFVRANPISRRNGQSAVACSAYRSSSKLYDERNDKTHDYSNKSGVIAVGVKLDDTSLRDRAELWNLVEQYEKRVDARLAKEYIIALPHELPAEEYIDLMPKIVNILADEKRLADWALHEPSKEGDDRNLHAHILVTERAWDYERGTFEQKKNRDWNTEEYLQKNKIEIGDVINIKLREKGLPELDMRSNEEKFLSGKDVAPSQEHKGVKRVNLERRLKREIKEHDKKIENLEVLGYGKTRRLTRDDGLDSTSNEGIKRAVERQRADNRARDNQRKREIENRERERIERLERENRERAERLQREKLERAKRDRDYGR